MQSHNFHQQRKVGQNHNYLFQIHRLPGNCQHTLKCGFGLTLTFCTLWSSSSLPFIVVCCKYISSHKVVLDRPGRNGDEVSAWSTLEMPDIIAKQRFPFSEYFKIHQWNKVVCFEYLRLVQEMPWIVAKLIFLESDTHCQRYISLNQ